MESQYSFAGWGRARILTSARRRRWAAVGVGSGLLALSHVLLWAWVGDRYSFCWSDCAEEQTAPPLVGSYLVLGICIWVLAPFAVAGLAGRSLGGTLLWGCGGVAAFVVVFAAAELIAPGGANSLPGLTLAVAVAGAILLPSRSRLDLIARGAAIALCLGVSVLLASVGIEALNWGNLAALPALAAVGLADELAQVASRRE